MPKNRFLRHIYGIFGGKNFFSKIGLGHVLSIPNTHLCAKNQEKQMIKSWENAKKPVFPAYFWHFRSEKYVFRKSGSVIFWALPICISVQNFFMKRYKVQLKKFKKYRCSAIPAIYREFRLQKSVYLTIEPCLMVGIVINNVFVWKNNEIKKKSAKNSDFGHIFGIFGRKKFFLKNRTRPCFEHS